MKAVTREIEYAGEVYEIRSKPTSHHFTLYLAKKQAAVNTPEEGEALFKEICEAAEAECLINGVWSKDIAALPSAVVNAWLSEITKGLDAEVKVRIKQQKN